MKKYILIVYMIIGLDSIAQQTTAMAEQELEQLANDRDQDTEDDSRMQSLEKFSRHPLNINTATRDELKSLQLINDLQIDQLLIYRRLMGLLIDVHELQAIPSWDITTIQRLLPFIIVSINEIWQARFSKGEQQLLFRIGGLLQKAKGYTDSIGYTGSQQRMFLRYRYFHKKLLQFGFTAEKDAGESFFNVTSKKGFDFYSAHLFASRLGVITALALGDFTVSMGQGLIQWQGMAFGKGADIMGVKRQSPVLHPYSSAGEFYFHRGMGVTISTKTLQATLFASSRKLDANVDMDTLGQRSISSFLTSGYHRTTTERENAGNIRQTAGGITIGIDRGKLHLGLNTVYYQFSLPVIKRNEPYNLFSLRGNNWYNASIDYSYSFRNMHLFGELAVDKNRQFANVHGLLWSIDHGMDLSVFYRSISRAYQAVYGNAFTERTTPSNEEGFYLGIGLRPAYGWKLDGYFDIFRFPWLQYQVDAPSIGVDMNMQLTYTPNKQAEWYMRYRKRVKQNNDPGVDAGLATLPQQNWRIQFMQKLNGHVSIRSRLEMLWYDKKGKWEETGYHIYTDIIYKPMLKKYSGVIRLHYFETASYNSRLYAYENDVQYSYSIPPVSGRGFRYYITADWDVTKTLKCWLRLASTQLLDNNTIGSGLDQLPSSSKTEWKFQVVLRF